MSIDIDWDKILERLIKMALPIIIGGIIKMLKNWLEGAPKEDIVAMVDKVGEAVKNEMA